MNIGKAIKICRIQKNLSQEMLANKAGISISYLSLLEKNKRDPSMSTIRKIAKAFNLPISIIIFLASEKSELEGLSKETIEKLSASTLQLISESAKDD